VAKFTMPLQSQLWR